MEKKHSIVLIQNDNGDYLQYFDEIWNSYLFLNTKMIDENDFEKIVLDIKEKYGLEISDLKLVLDKIHTKFSEKDKIMKEYHHYFYNATLNNEASDDKFKYFSYEELENDERIQEVNSDIVGFIKELRK